MLWTCRGDMNAAWLEKNLLQYKSNTHITAISTRVTNAAGTPICSCREAHVCNEIAFHCYCLSFLLFNRFPINRQNLMSAATRKSIGRDMKIIYISRWKLVISRSCLWEHCVLFVNRKYFHKFRCDICSLILITYCLHIGCWVMRSFGTWTRISFRYFGFTSYSLQGDWSIADALLWIT